MKALKAILLSFLFLINYFSYGKTSLNNNICNINSSFSITKHSNEITDCENPFTVVKKNNQIEFGTTLSLMVINNTDEISNWQIQNNLGVLKTGVGNKTDDFLFSIPGKYRVIFSAPASGTHTAHADTAFVNVLPIKMVIHTEEAKISSTPILSQKVDGMYLLIPVEISSFKGESVEFGPFTSNSTGIDGISATFSKTEKLKPGIHELRFELTGTPSAAGPIQIGFFNFLGEGFFYNFLISNTK